MHISYVDTRFLQWYDYKFYRGNLLIIMHVATVRLSLILEDNLSRDLLYQMSNIEYPYVNNDWLWV